MMPRIVALIAASLAGMSIAQGDYAVVAEGGQVRFSISAAHGNLVAARAGGAAILGQCEDEYWVESDDGSISGRSSEAADIVEKVRRRGKMLALWCRNDKLGLELLKIYAPAPLPGGLRKTVQLRAPEGRGIVHVFSRVRLAKAYAREAYLYTPRQSWGGKQLLFGVRRLADITKPLLSSCGWDNRFVVAFHRRRDWAVAHWRSLVEGKWAPYSGIIAPWGKTSPFGLTYLPDGWHFRLLHCPAGARASAAVDYVILRGDWYDAWAAYKKLPGFRQAYRSLDSMPRWCQQVKYGTFWQPPDADSFADYLRPLLQRLGGNAYVTVGVFGWSLDGDYETDRPFMMETLRLVLTPEFMVRCVRKLQQVPRVKVGLYIQGGLIDSVSQCFADHPEWVIHGRDGKPISSGFHDNAIGDMYMGNPCVEAWVAHHTQRIAAVCRRYGCGFIYLDGGGYGEDFDWVRRQAITFADYRRLNARVLETVRSTGPQRALLINCQNAPFADMSWLECGYFNPNTPWRETVDFCFDTACLRDRRYTLEPLYWRDEDRYLAMCIAFGFTPCGAPQADKPPAVWRAIEAAWEAKRARLVLDSGATAPVWWRDGVPVVTFAQYLPAARRIVVLNFSDDTKVRVTFDLAALGLGPAAAARASVYQPLLSAKRSTVAATPVAGGRWALELQVPTSWRGITLVSFAAR